MTKINANLPKNAPKSVKIAPIGAILLIFSCFITWTTENSCILGAPQEKKLTFWCIFLFPTLALSVGRPLRCCPLIMFWWRRWGVSTSGDKGKGLWPGWGSLPLVTKEQLSFVTISLFLVVQKWVKERVESNGFSKKGRANRSFFCHR